MYRRPKDLREGRGRYCSRACRNRAHPNVGPRPNSIRYGAANPAWKGGVTARRRKGNYQPTDTVICPPDLATMRHANGRIPIHRLVMARWVGRALTRAECVNHIDHDTTNNERANLELWPTNRDHKLGEVGRLVPGVANRWSKD